MQPAQPRLFMMMLLMLLNAVSLSAIPVDKHLAAELAFNRTADQLAEEILHSTSFLALEEAQPIAGTLLREHVKSRVRKELLPAHAALGSALEAVEAVLEKEAGAVDECPFGLPVAKVEDKYYQIYPRTGTAAEQREKDFHMYTCICTNAFGFKGFNPTWIDGMFRVRESGSVSPPMANLPGWAEKCKSKTHTAIANVVNSTTKVVGKIGKNIYNGVTRAGALIEIQAIDAEIARLEASGLDPEEVDRLKKLKKEVWVAMLEAQDDFAQQVDGLRKSLVEEVKGIETQALGCLADESEDCKSLWRKTLGLFSDCTITLEDIQELFDPSSMVPFANLPSIFNEAKEQFHALQGIDGAVKTVLNTLDGTFTNTPFHIIAATACDIIWETIDAATFKAFDKVAQGLQMVNEKCPALARTENPDGDWHGNPALAISVAIQGAAGVSGSVAAVEFSAAVEGGVAISARGQRMCFVGACVGSTVGASIGAQAGASGSGSVTLSIVGDAGMLPGPGSSVGVSLEGSFAKAVGFKGGLGFDLLLPDAVDFRAMDEDGDDDEMELEKTIRYLKYAYKRFQGVSFSTELGGKVGIGATVGAGVTFGLCWTPICITEAGNGCGMIYTPENPDAKEMCAADPCSKTKISKIECAKKKCGRYKGRLDPGHSEKVKDDSDSDGVTVQWKRSNEKIERQDSLPCEKGWALEYGDLQKKIMDQALFRELGTRLKSQIAVSTCKDDDGESKRGLGWWEEKVQAEKKKRIEAEKKKRIANARSMERGIGGPGAHHPAAETEALEEALDALSDAIA